MAVQARMAVTVKTNDSPGNNAEKEESMCTASKPALWALVWRFLQKLNRGQERRLGS